MVSGGLENVLKIFAIAGGCCEDAKDAKPKSFNFWAPAANPAASEDCTVEILEIAPDVAVLNAGPWVVFRVVINDPYVVLNVAKVDPPAAVAAAAIDAKFATCACGVAPEIPAAVRLPPIVEIVEFSPETTPVIVEAILVIPAVDDARVGLAFVPGQVPDRDKEDFSKL